MRSFPHAVAISCLITILVACQAGSVAAGWRGTDVHLVDGTWIGTETACGNSDDQLECRVVVDAGLQALPPDVRSQVTRAVLTALPTAYVTASGEARTARLTAGIQTRKAIAVDLTDGTRRVVGLWCYLPYASPGDLLVGDVNCAIVPLDYWRDGNAPPSYPTGTAFG